MKKAALCLALITMLTACTPKKENESSPPAQVDAKPDTPANLGQIADYLVGAADDYNKIERAALLDGLEGGEGAQATRVQALVMVSRAFGDLPEPKGNNARLSPEAADLSGMPGWAKSDLENLNRGG